METTNQTASAAKEERETLSMRFSKKLVGEPFTRKEDGVEFRQVSIPNENPEDKSPWKTFVVRSSDVKADKFNDKLAYITMPKDGYTTVKSKEVVGIDPLGKKQYAEHTERVNNEDLKAMVESYKTRNREVDDNPFDNPPKEEIAPVGEAQAEKKEKTSLRGRMQEKKEQVAAKKAERAKETAEKIAEGKTDIPIVPKKGAKDQTL